MKAFRLSLILLVVTLTIPLVAEAQSGFPTYTTEPGRTYESIQRLAENEGADHIINVPLTVATTSGTVTSAVSNTLTNTTTVVYTTNLALNTQQFAVVGFAFIPSQAEFYFSKLVSGYYFTPYATSGPWQGYTSSLAYIWNTAPGERIIRPLSCPLHYTQRPVNPTISQVTDVISGTVTPAIGSTASVTFTYGYTVFGKIITDDLNLSATGYVDLWGDSILYGTGPTATENTIGNLLKEYWTDLGKNYRLRNKSIPGSTTGMHVAYMKLGQYYKEPKLVKVIVIQPVTNDINTGVAIATIVANKLLLINKALAMCPNAKIIVPAVTPRLNVTLEATAVAVRAAEKAAIIALPTYNSRVFYFESTGTSWTPTDASKYLASDGANGVHPVDATILNNLFPAYKANLDANPSIFN